MRQVRAVHGSISSTAGDPTALKQGSPSQTTVACFACPVLNVSCSPSPDTSPTVPHRVTSWRWSPTPPDRSQASLATFSTALVVSAIRSRLSTYVEWPDKTRRNTKEGNDHSLTSYRAGSAVQTAASCSLSAQTYSDQDEPIGRSGAHRPDLSPPV